MTECPHCGRQITAAEILMLDILDLSGCPLADPCKPAAPVAPAWPIEDEGGPDDREPPRPILPKVFQ